MSPLFVFISGVKDRVFFQNSVEPLKMSDWKPGPPSLFPEAHENFSLVPQMLDIIIYTVMLSTVCPICPNLMSAELRNN